MKLIPSTIVKKSRYSMWAIGVAVLLPGIFASIAHTAPGGEPRMGSSFTVQLPMQDGVRLETHVYHPAGDGPWPTVLMRDPYAIYESLCPRLTEYDYACVHQDVRGRSGSEGRFYPAINERSDGLETLDWLIEQPWQNDNIATYGSSYLGFVQWAMIDAMPEQVKTVVAGISHGDWYEAVYKNGHFVQGIISKWALVLNKPKAPPEIFDNLVAHRPAIVSNARYLDGKAQWYEDYLKHPEKTDNYWESPVYSAVRSNHKKAGMPVLMTGAWHDFFLKGQFEVFEALPTRDRSLFVIRNGHHAGSNKDDIDFEFNLVLGWFDRHLKEEVVDSLPESGYVLQSNLDNSRSHSETWPGDTERIELYLGDLPVAGACDAGSLLESEPTSEGSVSYIYDPENPVETRGGSFFLTAGGSLPQGSDICDREDVLSFESQVFNDSLVLSGSIKLVVEVASSVADSAFTVKLQEKMAEGRVYNIRDDLTSLSFRNGADSRQTYDANSAVEIVFNMTPIEWTLRPGSSLRLDISSSNYPMFNAHPNVVENWAYIESSPKATQTLYGGKLSLPVRQNR